MSKKTIEELCDDLRGTCEASTVEYCLDDYTQDELKWLDDQIRLCDVCGWWVETDECEITDHQICSQCKEEENE